MLRKIHSRGIIHQDLKPQNIMRSVEGNLVFIDFGLSLIVSNKNSPSQMIIKQKPRRGFIGTPRYASISAHQGIEQTPKDDLESFGYVLIYLSKGKLPWISS